MPKANKHAEVKPSKFKTSLCQFFAKGETCPYGSRCAFAHGEQELHLEEHNVRLLKSTGLQRLDHVRQSSSVDLLSVESSPLSNESISFPTPEDSITSLKPQRRRPIMVSLPKYNTTSESYQSPYMTASVETAAGLQRSSVYACAARGTEGHAVSGCTNCRCGFSSTCRRERPLVYRHNPYSTAARS